MANPPITIPPFTNVPAPGSPIRSDWPQTISTFLARHGCSLSHAMSVGTGATVTIPFGTEGLDTDNFHATNSTDIVCPSGLAGVYATSVHLDAGGTLNGPSTVLIINGALSFPFYITTNNRYGAGTVVWDIAVGGITKVQVYNGHSAAATFTIRVNHYRVSA